METKKDDNKRPSLRIESIYPHAFWLEKYNKENKFQSSLFENYLPNTKSYDRCNKYIFSLKFVKCILVFQTKSLRQNFIQNTVI